MSKKDAKDGEGSKIDIKNLERVLDSIQYYSGVLASDPKNIGVRKNVAAKKKSKKEREAREQEAAREKKSENMPADICVTPQLAKDLVDYATTGMGPSRELKAALESDLSAYSQIASSNVIKYRGFSPLDIAMRRNHFQVIRYFTQHGAHRKDNKTDEYEKRGIFLECAALNNINIFRHLLHNAEYSLLGVHSVYITSIYQGCGDLSVMQMIVDIAKINPDIILNHNEALSAACRVDRLDIMQFCIRQPGVDIIQILRGEHSQIEHQLVKREEIELLKCIVISGKDSQNREELKKFIDRAFILSAKYDRLQSICYLFPLMMEYSDNKKEILQSARKLAGKSIKKYLSYLVKTFNAPHKKIVCIACDGKLAIAEKSKDDFSPSKENIYRLTRCAENLSRAEIISIVCDGRSAIEAVSKSKDNFSSFQANIHRLMRFSLTLKEQCNHKERINSMSEMGPLNLLSVKDAVFKMIMGQETKDEGRHEDDDLSEILKCYGGKTIQRSNLLALAAGYSHYVNETKEIGLDAQCHYIEALSKGSADENSEDENSPLSYRVLQSVVARLMLSLPYDLSLIVASYVSSIQEKWAISDLRQVCIKLYGYTIQSDDRISARVLSSAQNGVSAFGSSNSSPALQAPLSEEERDEDEEMPEAQVQPPQEGSGGDPKMRKPQLSKEGVFGQPQPQPPKSGGSSPAPGQ